MGKRRTAQVPISVCLIGRNCAADIKRFNREVIKPLFKDGHEHDEVIFVDTASTDNTIEEAKRHGWHVINGRKLVDPALLEYGRKLIPEELKRWEDHPHIKTGVLRSFAEARQLSFNRARNEIVFWLDMDDKLVGAKELRLFIDHCFGPAGRRGAIMLPYDYAFDEAGNCILTLWRERIVNKSDYEWRGACHEVLCPKRGHEHKINFMARDPKAPFRVQHLKPPKSHFADVRNYIIMRYDWDIRGNHDPRTLFYLGNACRGLERWREAIVYYDKFVTRSGNYEDVFSAYLGKIAALTALERYWEALDVTFQAEKIKPKDPRPLHLRADLFYRLRNYEAALEQIRRAEGMEIPDTLHAVDPFSARVSPNVLAVLCCRELGRPDEAVMYARRVLATDQSPMAQRLYHDTVAWARAEDVTRNQAVAVNTTRTFNDRIEVAKRLVISPHAADKGFASPESAVPGGYSGKPTLAIFCPHTSIRWGPLTDGRGLGASEKMVCLLAPRLAKRGLAVTVYCRLADPPGQYEGVHWRHYAEFNPTLYRDYVILWRAPQYLKNVHIAAGKKYVWVHDVMHDSIWTPDIVKQIDKVFFLSKYQRGRNPSVPESKVYYTRNGIDLKRHLYAGEPKQKKIVYLSCPTRGWITACKLFIMSGLARKGWELHLFYGFLESFDEAANRQIAGYIPDVGHEMLLREFQTRCYNIADSYPAIKRRGLVNWRQIAEELKTARIWLYPTRFDEISCVAAMEAQAAGLRAVTTDSAALAETMADYPGWINLSDMDKKDWVAALKLAAQTEPEAEKWSQFARKWDVESLADEWMRDLFQEVKNV